MKRHLQHNAGWFRDRLRQVNRTQADLSRFLKKDKGTISNMISGKRPLALSEIEPLARFLGCSTNDVLGAAGVSVSAQTAELESSHESIRELEMRSATGIGMVASLDGDDADQGVLEGSAVRDTWILPGHYARIDLGVSRQAAYIVEVQGDSMEPTLCSGDRVMIDVAQRTPSPPGIFALWDGVGVAVKRIELLLNTATPTLRVASDSPHLDDVTASLTDINIIGRVVWMGRKF